jgi:hypothetical protein
MAQNDLVQPVVAAATSQTKLCPYDEEEPHIWFRLIKAQFAAAIIRSQSLKYANALCPSQLAQAGPSGHFGHNRCLQRGSDQPFDHLKEVLFGEFGKSKWQSYFDLLCLPKEMQGLKPSALMGKLKQHLPPGVSPDKDLFLEMFFKCLPPSKREVVGPGNHKTATAIVKAANAL